jgi:hypothetical protein
MGTTTRFASLFLSLTLVACGGGGGGGSSPPQAAAPRSDLLFGYSDRAVGDYERVPRETRHQANIVWLRSTGEGVWHRGAQIPSGQGWGYFAALGMYEAHRHGSKAILELPDWIHAPGGVQQLADWLTYMPFWADSPQTYAERYGIIKAVAIPIPPGYPKESVELTASAVRLVLQLVFLSAGVPVPSLVGIYGPETGGVPGAGSFDWLAYTSRAAQLTNGEYDEFARHLGAARAVLIGREVLDGADAFHAKAEADMRVVAIVAPPWDVVKAANRIERFCIVGQRATGRSGACVAG